MGFNGICMDLYRFVVIQTFFQLSASDTSAGVPKQSASPGTSPKRDLDLCRAGSCVFSRGNNDMTSVVFQGFIYCNNKDNDN